MNKDMYLTRNQHLAMTALINSCLHNIGGDNLQDLRDDPCVWVEVYDLIKAGWSRKEAEGTFGSLVAEGLIYSDDGARHSSEPQPFALTEDWDELSRFHSSYSVGEVTRLNYGDEQ